MPRNYKTGPARSRRRPDPSNTASVNAVVFPLGNIAITPGAGSLQIVAFAFNALTGTEIDPENIQATGKASAMRFVNTSGAIFTPTASYNNLSGQMTWAITSGLPADDYVASLPSLEQAIRGVNGEFIGTLFQTATVT